MFVYGFRSSFSIFPSSVIAIKPSSERLALSCRFSFIVTVINTITPVHNKCEFNTYVHVTDIYIIRLAKFR
jgi:hypothetical protein